MFDCPANGVRQSSLLNSTRNAHWHNCPIFPIYRLGTLSTYSQTTPTSFNGSTHTTMHCSGSTHTTSIGTTCSSLCSIALHTPNVNRHRLGNLSIYSPTTPTSFTWIYALNHALHFTFRLLTGGPSTSATLDPFTQPVSALNAFHSFRLHCTRRMSIDTAQFHMTCNPIQAATNALYSRYID
jgi:hypothetical protein